ncbi:MAG TPA: hypothetical protein VNB06_02280 [Thermoanaerobaculia bacterium]|nr:hypothetical protein [Thermoanaerobaculia bacterium]
MSGSHSRQAASLLAIASFVAAALLACAPSRVSTISTVGAVAFEYAVSRDESSSATAASLYTATKESPSVLAGVANALHEDPTIRQRQVSYWTTEDGDPQHGIESAPLHVHFGHGEAGKFRLEKKVVVPVAELRLDHSRHRYSWLCSCQLMRHAPRGQAHEYDPATDAEKGTNAFAFWLGAESAAARPFGSSMRVLCAGSTPVCGSSDVHTVYPVELLIDETVKGRALADVYTHAMSYGFPTVRVGACISQGDVDLAEPAPDLQALPLYDVTVKSEDPGSSFAYLQFVVPASEVSSFSVAATGGLVPPLLDPGDQPRQLPGLDVASDGLALDAEPLLAALRDAAPPGTAPRGRVTVGEGRLAWVRSVTPPLPLAASPVPESLRCLVDGLPAWASGAGEHLEKCWEDLLPEEKELLGRELDRVADLACSTTPRAASVGAPPCFDLVESLEDLRVQSVHIDQTPMVDLGRNEDSYLRFRKAWRIKLPLCVNVEGECIGAVGPGFYLDFSLNADGSLQAFATHARRLALSFTDVSLPPSEEILGRAREQLGQMRGEAYQIPELPGQARPRPVLAGYFTGGPTCTGELDYRLVYEVSRATAADDSLPEEVWVGVIAAGSGATQDCEPVDLTAPMPGFEY